MGLHKMCACKHVKLSKIVSSFINCVITYPKIYFNENQISYQKHSYEKLLAIFNPFSKTAYNYRILKTFKYTLTNKFPNSSH